MVFRKCMATIGSVGNDEHMNERLGKAGRTAGSVCAPPCEVP